MKVVVIGCTHAGTAAIVNLKKLNPEAEVVVFERNDNISFLSCGIALYVGGIVKDPAGLFYSSPEALANMGVKTHMKHDVKSVNINGKSLEVENIVTGEKFTETYDKLIITSGSWPIVPKFEGGELENILLCKNYNHSNAIIEKAKNAKKVVVIGAGYIGVELVEAFRDNGKEVVLVDAEERIMPKYFDKEFTDAAENSFRERGIVLATGEKVVKFEGEHGKVTKVITNKNEHNADMVILCIGFLPNTGLFKGQLDMLPNGAIKVDEYMRTSHPDVMAAGDCCSVFYNPLGEEMYIPLATNAVRMGTLAGLNIKENKAKLVTTGEDIAREFLWDLKNRKNKTDKLTYEEKIVFLQLSEELGLEEIMKKIKNFDMSSDNNEKNRDTLFENEFRPEKNRIDIPVNKLLSILMSLKVKGLISETGTARYMRIV